MTEFEIRGVPGVYVASAEFLAAGEAQARALGLQPAVVSVPHPIQDRTDAEMESIADGALAAVVAALTGPAGGGSAP